MTVQLAMENRKFTAIEIAFLIKLYRDQLGMKQEVLAQKANVSVRTIERAESGKDGNKPTDII